MNDAEVRELGRKAGDGDLQAAEALAAELRRRHGMPGAAERLALALRAVQLVSQKLSYVDPEEDVAGDRASVLVAEAKDAVASILKDHDAWTKARIESFYERESEEKDAFHLERVAELTKAIDEIRMERDRALARLSGSGVPSEDIRRGERIREWIDLMGDVEDDEQG